MEIIDVVVIAIIFLTGIVVGAAIGPAFRSRAERICSRRAYARMRSELPRLDGPEEYAGIAPSMDPAKWTEHRFSKGCLVEYAEGLRLRRQGVVPSIVGRIEREIWANRQKVAQPPNGSPEGVIRMKGDEPFISLRNRD